MISVDIKHKDLNLYIDGQLVLHINQISDDKVIHLFFYPEGKIIKFKLPEEESNECTHELLIDRKE